MRRIKKDKLFFVLIFIASSLIMACDPAVKVEKKELKGFAFYKNPDKLFLYKAVTAEGVVLQVSKIENYPKKADSAFWKDAILEYLPQKGYKMVEEGKTAKGQYFLFLVPRVRFDYFYFIHYEILDGNILLTESGGRFGLFSNHKQQILEFCGQIHSKVNN